MIPLDIPDRDQFQIYNHIYRDHEYSFLFESLAGPEVLAETSIMGFSPSAILRVYADRIEKTVADWEGAGRGGGDSKARMQEAGRGQGPHARTETIRAGGGGDPFASLRRILEDAASDAEDAQPPGPDAVGAKDGGAAAPDPRGYRYLGGAVGMVNYDAIRTIERIPDSNGSDPLLMEFGIYDDGILYDNGLERPFYFYRGKNRLGWLALEGGRGGDGGGGGDDMGGAGPAGRFRAGAVAPNMDASQFYGMVARAKEYIINGDIFQAVLSRRFEFDVEGDTLAPYRALRVLNPSPYMYHMRHGFRATIGASPEMLVRITGDTVETFPIAGTRRVTGDRGEDARLAEEMLADQKEIAEHTMLVDLGRNDIGRVCRFGTVRPRSLMETKRFSHVQHIVTHLAGTLDDGMDMFDAFRAVFPAGTVSGAPKVRAMEIIDELEPDARGPYAGAVGYFSYSGCCDFAIAIRSIFISGGRGFVQSGAGIVYDSIPEHELKETEHKAGAMLQALSEASLQ